MTIIELKERRVSLNRDGEAFYVSGYYAENDGGGGIFVFDTASVANDDGGSVIAPSSGLGRYVRVVGESVDAKWFGAKGDGSTDDAQAIQAAVTYAAAEKLTLIFSPGDYLVGTSIAIENPVYIKSNSVLDSTVRMLFHGGMDDAWFDISTRCVIEGLCFVGSDSDEKTNQVAIHIDGAEHATIRQCFFINLYDHARIDGESFYTTFDRCHFYSARRSWVYGVGTTDAGFDLAIKDCRGSSNTTTQAYGFYFEELGSVVMSGCVFTPAFMATAGIHVESLALNAGACFFSDSVIEINNGLTPSLVLKGEALAPIKHFKFNGCYLWGGGITSQTPAVLLVYARNISFTGCYFSGNGSAINVSYLAMDVSCHECSFEVLGNPIEANYVTAGSAITEVSMSLTDNVYSGAASFVYMPNLSSSQIGYLKVDGGRCGTHTSKVDIANPNSITKDIRVFGQASQPIVQTAIFTGSLDGGGEAQFTHGITNGNSRIISAYAWARGGDGEAVPASIDFVDGANVSVTNVSYPGANYRVFIQFTTTSIAW